MSSNGVFIFNTRKIGQNQVFNVDSLSERPISGLKVGDILIVESGTYENWVFEWGGTSWAVRVAYVPDWVSRLSNHSLPTGVTLDSDSIMEVSLIGRGTNIRFIWNQTMSMWLLESLLSLSVEQALRGDTPLMPGERLLAYEPIRGGIRGTGITANGITSMSNEMRDELTGTSRFGIDASGWPYQEESAGTSNQRLDTSNSTLGSGCDAITIMAVAARLNPSPPEAPSALTIIFGIDRTTSGQEMACWLSVDNEDIKMWGRHTVAEQVDYANGAIDPGINEYFCVIGTVDYINGSITLYQDGQQVGTGIIPGTPRALPSYTNGIVRTGFSSSTNRGIRRRGIWMIERSLTADELDLMFSIMLSIKNL